MEGPSIVIATEEFAPHFGKPLKKVSGTADLHMAQIKKRRLTEARSWGKHLILIFGDLKLRIHFLMFGSYRINKPRENRIPKLEIQIGTDTLICERAVKKRPTGKLKRISHYCTHCQKLQEI